VASLCRDPNGTKRILFTLDGRRRCLRLGRMPVKAAQTFKARVEALVWAAQSNTSPDSDTAQWAAALGPELFDKLAALGLVAERKQQAAAALKPFLVTYLGGRIDLKPATKIVQGQVVRDLAKFFGESRDVRTVLPGDADDFKQWLIGRGLAPTTTHKRLQVARSFFRAMRRRKLIHENPFAEVSAPATGIKDRQRFVTREETKRLLAACPNVDWRGIVALARYGGLRCPSEVLSVEWRGGDWAGGRIRVESPKTEHHAGKASRTIPLFPELRPILAEAFELAPDGAEYVVGGEYRKAAMGANGWMNCNLRTQFQRVVKRAGLEPWPRLFHNLRASRETELAGRFPIHVVTAWLGNTPRVALKHYLQVTDADFERAAGGGEEAAQNAAQNAAHFGDNSAQKAAQPASATSRQEPQETTKPQGALGVRPLSADAGETWQESLVAGFALPSNGLQIAGNSWDFITSDAPRIAA